MRYRENATHLGMLHSYVSTIMGLGGWKNSKDIYRNFTGSFRKQEFILEVTSLLSWSPTLFKVPNENTETRKASLQSREAPPTPSLLP